MELEKEEEKEALDRDEDLQDLEDRWAKDKREQRTNRLRYKHTPGSNKGKRGSNGKVESGKPSKRRKFQLMEDDWGTQKTTLDPAKTTKDEGTPGGMVLKGAVGDWMGGAVVEGVRKMINHEEHGASPTGHSLIRECPQTPPPRYPPPPILGVGSSKGSTTILDYFPKEAALSTAHSGPLQDGTETDEGGGQYNAKVERIPIGNLGGGMEEPNNACYEIMNVNKELRNECEGSKTIEEDQATMNVRDDCVPTTTPSLIEKEKVGGCEKAMTDAGRCVENEDRILNNSDRDCVIVKNACNTHECGVTKIVSSTR